jgi:insertion element IS1 protein InsB
MWKYSDEQKKEALRYHNEGIPFRVIERLLHISHNSVIRWVKEAAGQIKKIVSQPQKEEKCDILEIDELWHFVHKKNEIWIWLAVERSKQEIKGFFVGNRSYKSFEKLSEIIGNINTKKYATDDYGAYGIINPTKHIVGKAHTFTVERTNRRLRHYLARFVRKSYSVSQSIHMVVNSLYVWVFKHLIPSLIL